MKQGRREPLSRLIEPNVVATVFAGTTTGLETITLATS
jgi:hypothetical protein